MPDTPPLVVTADDKTAFSGVNYKEVTPYKPIPANADDFKVKPASQDTGAPLAENSESIMSGRHYTLVTFPEPVTRADGMRDRPDADRPANGDKKVSLDVIADDLVPPSAGKARVRVINAAAGTDDVEVYLRGQNDALFSDVDFKEAVSYKEVDPMTTTLELRTDRSGLTDVNPKTGHVLGTHSLNFEAGKSYTILLMGRADGARGQLEMLVVEDMVPQTTDRTN